MTDIQSTAGYPLPLVDGNFDTMSDSDSPLDFHPYAYDDDFASVNSHPHAKQYPTREPREIDKDAHLFYRRNQDGALVRVMAYKTICSPNRLIRDAVTGVRTQYRTCTADEDLFFSICMATGETGQEPAILFYDNPEQYERHFKTKVSNETKTQWIAKLMSARERLDRLNKESSKPDKTEIK